MKLTPVKENVILKVIEKEEEVSESGIILPSSKKDDSPIYEVIAVGPNVLIDIKPGDKVVIDSLSGRDHKVGDTVYRFINYKGIVAQVID